ncbi:MAG TPA: M14 family zinc carboxypeptidase [Gemmatimonadales bacterium]
MLGYEPGDRFTSHAMLTRYIERVAATSRRIHVDTVAHSFEGREDLVVVATSEANQGQLEQLRGAMARLADPRGASPGDLEGAVTRARPAVFLMYTVHGGEASGVEAAIALIYQLAAGQDTETRMVLDSCIVLIDPVENPDGHERHVQDVNRMRGAFGVPVNPSAMIHQGTWPGPRTSHYYFDLNRDWYAQSHPESRGRIATMMKWWPVTVADLHEQGYNATYFFPPPMAPVNKNIPDVIRRGWDLYAAANIAAFDRQGWSFFRREGYDEFYPGYGDSWPILTGAVGMTYEQASSNGGAILRADGTVLTLHDAAWHHYTASWATLVTTAMHARDRLRDFLGFRQAAIAETNQNQHAVVIERDDQGRADSLAARLLDNGIEVQRLRGSAEAREAVEYGGSTSTAQLPAGSYLVDLAQPQGTLARALLEPDAELDSTFIKEELERRRTGEPDRFYDITGWTLPLAYRVRAWATRVPPQGGERVAMTDLRGVAPAPIENARYGYAFRPGSEASLRLLASLLADSVRVWFAPRPFAQDGQRFPSGVFVVRVSANRPDVHERVRARAAESGATVVPLSSAAADDGIDLGSNSSFPVRTPLVALLGGSPISGNSFGFAWFAFEQRLGYPVTPVAAQGLGGATLAAFDVLVIPSVGSGALDNALGEGGRNALSSWVRAGGTLITIDGATQWLASEHTGLARLRLRRDTTRADSTAGAALPSSVPGALVRAYGDTLSPLLAGIRGDIPVLTNSDRVYTAPKDLHPGEAVVHFAAKPRLRLSGYLWPEMPDRLSESVYLWTEEVGRGRVIGFAGDPNFRDQFRGLLPLFANAVFLGHSM